MYIPQQQWTHKSCEQHNKSIRWSRDKNVKLQQKKQTDTYVVGLFSRMNNLRRTEKKNEGFSLKKRRIEMKMETATDDRSIENGIRLPSTSTSYK